MKRKAAAPAVLAVVPAYNEGGGVADVVRELSEVRPRLDVLVVDDGSSDRTAERAAQAGARVVRLPYNLGIGGAVQTGFRYAVRNGYDVAVQVDGDGQHVPSEIPALLAALWPDVADVAIGSRFLSAGGYTTTRLRRVGTRVFERVNSWVLGQTITDNTSGFRAYNRKAFAFLAEHYPQDYPEPESVVLLGRNGFRIREVPIRMRERGHGRSSISSFQSVYYMVKVLLAIFVDCFKAKTIR
jgi:glycosyltransferase involved in cell wall biosynthesis